MFGLKSIRNRLTKAVRDVGSFASDNPLATAALGTPFLFSKGFPSLGASLFGDTTAGGLPNLAKLLLGGGSALLGYQQFQRDKDMQMKIYNDMMNRLLATDRKFGSEFGGSPFKNEQFGNLIADIKNFGKKIIKDPLDKDSATVTGATGEVPVNKFTKVVTTSDGVQRELIEEVNVSSMLRGLRESILGHVLTKSGLESTGPFNPAKAYEMLFQPIKGVGGRRRQSLATWMRSNKLITDTELKTFEKVLGNMQKIQSQQASGEIDVSTAENAFFQFTTRVAGATAGQTFQRFMFPNTAAGGLIAESSGSKLFQKFLLAIPDAARQDTMLEVMKDPTYLAQLMRDVRDEKVALSVIDFMKRKLKEASIIAVTGSVRRTAPAAKEEDLLGVIR